MPTETDTNKRSYAQVTPKLPPKNATLTILKMLHGGMYAQKISTELKRSKTTIHRHIQKLIKLGLLQEEVRSFSKVYQVTSKGDTAIIENKLPRSSCISTRDTKLTNYVRIYIPILKRGRIPDEFWDKVNDNFKNSVIKHKDISKLFEGASVRETTRGVEISLTHRKIGAIKDVYVMVTNTVFWAIGYFSNYGYILDNKNFYVNDTHTSIWTERFEKEAKEHGRVTVTFPESRTKITPRDPNQPMKAYFDKTPPPGGRESNSLSYAEDCLREPVRVRNLESDMQQVKEMINGMLAPIQAASNTGLMTATAYKQQTELMERQTELMEKIAGKKETRPETPILEPSEQSVVKVEMIKDMPEVKAKLNGYTRYYKPLMKGARILVDEQEATHLIYNGYAKFIENISENKAMQSG